MLFVETPTNPILSLTDLAAAGELARSHDLRLVVDNTFASPYNQRPIELGADLVTHSTTKYLNGHSDSIGGVVVAVRDEDIEWLKFVQNAEGAILGPFDSWLVLRGTKTLPLPHAAAQRQRPGARRVPGRAPEGRHVYYPGLPTHPQHELARRQMRGFGGMIAFELGSLESARRLLNGVRLCSLAESLGGVETLDLASRDHDPRLGARRSTDRARHHRRPRPHLGRHRGPRRSEGGSDAGPRSGLRRCA